MGLIVQFGVVMFCSKTREFRIQSGGPRETVINIFQLISKKKKEKKAGKIVPDYLISDPGQTQC